MSKFTQKLNIANFICKFGDNKVLLDLCDEVILPAFKDNLVRSYGDESKYFFHGVEVLDLSTTEQPEVAICGRIIKETQVSRDQIFLRGEIVKDHKELESAPSSFFVLLLSNHKLLYVRENSGAPSIQTFSSTIGTFIKQKHRAWIDMTYKDRNSEGRVIKRVDLLNEWPVPSIETVELSTNTDIRKFMRKFRVINTVEIKLLSTNHENDNSPLFRRLRKIKDQLGSDQLVVKNEKSGDVGLNKGDVADFIAGQAEEANSRIMIRGKDLEGTRLNADNDHFKVAVPVKVLPQSVEDAAKYAVGVLFKQLELGTVVMKKGHAEAMRKLKILKDKLEF